MMCLKTFTKKHRDDFETIEQWCDFVNENQRYAQTKSKKFDWVGRCDYWELPSTHPYWEPPRRNPYVKFFFEKKIFDVIPNQMVFSSYTFKNKYKKQIFKMMKDIESGKFKTKEEYAPGFKAYYTLCEYLQNKYKNFHKLYYDPIHRNDNRP